MVSACAERGAPAGLQVYSLHLAWTPLWYLVLESGRPRSLIEGSDIGYRFIVFYRRLLCISLNSTLVRASIRDAAQRVL